MKKLALSLYPQDAEIFSSWDIAGKPISTIIHLWPSKPLKADIRSKDCDWKSTYLRKMAFRITPNAIEDDLKFSTQELFLIVRTSIHLMSSSDSGYEALEDR